MLQVRRARGTTSDGVHRHDPRSGTSPAAQRHRWESRAPALLLLRALLAKAAGLARAAQSGRSAPRAPRRTATTGVPGRCPAAGGPGARRRRTCTPRCARTGRIEPRSTADAAAWELRRFGGPRRSSIRVAVNAVLAAAGDRGRGPQRWPAGLHRPGGRGAAPESPRGRSIRTAASDLQPGAQDVDFTCRTIYLRSGSPPGGRDPVRHPERPAQP